MLKFSTDKAQLTARLLTNSFWTGAEMLSKNLLGNSPAAPLVSASLGVVRSTFGDNLTKGLAQRLSQPQEPPEVRDLNRAIGVALRTVLEQASTHDSRLTTHDSPAEALAKAAPAFWSQMAEADRSLLASEVTDYYATRASEIGTVGALTPQLWRQFLVALSSEADVTVEEPLLDELAETLHTAFPETLRKILLEDQEKGGQSYASLTLMLIGEMTALLRQGQVEDQQRHSEVIARLEQIQGSLRTTPVTVTPPPSGTVTLLLAAIVDSAVLWDTDANVMNSMVRALHAQSRTIIESHEGFLLPRPSDGVRAAFKDAGVAISAARDILRISDTLRSGDSHPITLRIVLHSGSFESNGENYFGPAVHRAERLLSLCGGQQVLLSGAAAELAQATLPAGFALRDLGPVRLKDSPNAEQVFQLLHADLSDEAPSLLSVSRAHNNLPEQLTSFVGRDREVREIRQLFGPPLNARLVTLAGFGGGGKTRLALQAAEDLLAEFEDGAWLVELAPLSDANLLAQAAATILNVREEPGKPLVNALADSLKHKRLLLVLDNCEHLVEACARLADTLLRQCPNVRILATSREPLGISGEQTYRVPSLGLPDLEALPGVEDLRKFGAIRLFEERAALVKPEFEITDDNRAVVARICRRLDGIPLAIELAAARIRSLPVEQVEARLTDRFRLLTGGSRAALPRQQTLRALIDWSYDLLQESEKTLLRRASLFVGGWALAAAEEVCQGGAVEDWEVLDLLTALVEKSLVIRETTNDDVRYRLLETIRDYSIEKRETEDDARDAVDRHAAYFRRLVTETIPNGASRSEGFVVLDGEVGNIRAAMETLWRSGAADEAAEVAVSLRDFWYYKGRFGEALAHLQVAASRADVKDPELRARVFKDAGWFAFLLRDLRTAETLTTAGVETAREAGATAIQANALNGLALIAQTLGDSEKAETLFRQAIDLRREIGLDTVLADYQMNLGFLKSTLGKHAEAQELFAEAKSIYEERSNEMGMATWLCNQSDLSLRQKNWQDAEAFARQSLELFRQIGNRLGVSYALANLAEAAARRSIYSEAMDAVREALAICRETDHRDLLPTLFTTATGVALAQERFDAAARLAAGASRLRTLLNIAPTAEEAEALLAIEEGIRGHHAEENITAANKQFFSLEAGEVVKRLEALC